MPVLLFQAERAFHAVPDYAIEKLLVCYGQVSAEEYGKLDSSESLALFLSEVILGKHNKNAKEGDLEAALAKRRECEKLPEGTDIPAEVLDAVMLKSEAVDVRNWSADEKALAEKGLRTRQTAKACVRAYQQRDSRTAANVESGGGGSAPSSSSSANSSTQTLAAQKQVERWVASVKAGDPAALEALKPPGSSMLVYEPKGAILVTVRGKRKSVSWTIRGYPQAIYEALVEAWKLHCTLTGEMCPHDLEALKP